MKIKKSNRIRDIQGFVLLISAVGVGYQGLPGLGVLIAAIGGVLFCIGAAEINHFYVKSVNDIIGGMMRDINQLRTDFEDDGGKIAESVVAIEGKLKEITIAKEFDL